MHVARGTRVAGRACALLAALWVLTLARPAFATTPAPGFPAPHHHGHVAASVMHAVAADSAVHRLIGKGGATDVAAFGTATSLGVGIAQSPAAARAADLLSSSGTSTRGPPAVPAAPAQPAVPASPAPPVLPVPNEETP